MLDVCFRADECLRCSNIRLHENNLIVVADSLIGIVTDIEATSAVWAVSYEYIFRPRVWCCITRAHCCVDGNHFNRTLSSRHLILDKQRLPSSISRALVYYVMATRTFSSHLADWYAFLLRHVTEHREDDETGVDAGAAVHEWDDQCVSVIQHNCMMQILNYSFSVLKHTDPIICLSYSARLAQSVEHQTFKAHTSLRSYLRVKGSSPLLGAMFFRHFVSVSTIIFRGYAYFAKTYSYLLQMFLID